MNNTIFKIAWRNIWRNKLRSSVIITAVMVGLFGGLVASGIMKGMVTDMVNNALENQVSHIQIHNKQFAENNEVGFIIKNTPAIEKKILQNQSVKAVSSRTKSYGMASTASKGSGIMINGVEPDREKKVTMIHNKLTEGNYFTSNKRNRILISEKLAKKLKVKLKSKIVITFQDYDGNLTGAAFKVEGIFKTQNGTFDEQNVFVRKRDLDRLLNLPANASHEIAILLYSYEITPEVLPEIKKNVPGYLVQPWYDIDPYLQLTASLTGFMLSIFMTIILLALGFAIVNTMLMVVLERTKELGMIMAIGMNKMKVFRMIMYETSLLGIIGGILGMLLSWWFTVHFGEEGISISMVAQGFEAYGYGSVMYPVLELTDYVQVAVMVLITGVIASIFPTIRALKMKPVEAIRN
jgi:ABC-type lipoprotein release transport system permease subunit